MKTPCSNPACGHVDDSEHPQGHICPQPPADKPRADLVPLLDAFAALPEGHAMLSLFGSEHEAPLRAWAAQHHRGVREQALENATDGRWTHLEVRVPGGWINVHCDHEATAPADPQVLARVQAALDGEQRDEDGNRIMDPAEVAAREGIEQPEAAEGSV